MPGSAQPQGITSTGSNAASVASSSSVSASDSSNGRGDEQPLSMIPRAVLPPATCVWPPLMQPGVTKRPLLAERWCGFEHVPPMLVAEGGIVRAARVLVAHARFPSTPFALLRVVKAQVLPSG